MVAAEHNIKRPFRGGSENESTHVQSNYHPTAAKGIFVFMKFLEKDLETIIYDNIVGCRDRGLYDLDCHSYLRQVNLGSYGILDLIGVTIENKRNGYRDISITIFELKKELIDASTLLQAFRYRVGIKRLLANKVRFKHRLNFKIVLIGKQIQESGDFVFALDALDCVSTYTYDYHFDGIRFNCMDNEGWRHTNESFQDKNYKSFLKYTLKTKIDYEERVRKYRLENEQMPF